MKQMAEHAVFRRAFNEQSPFFAQSESSTTTGATVSRLTSGTCTPNYSVGQRTPISARAKPFIPGLAGRQQQQNFGGGAECLDLVPRSPVIKPPGVWHHPAIREETFDDTANVWLPVTLVQILPGWGSFTLGGCASREKSMQDESSEQVYNEQLQDDVYLKEGLREAATRLLAGSNGAPRPPELARNRLASRTPSPPPQLGLHPDVPRLGFRAASVQDLLDRQQSVDSTPSVQMSDPDQTPLAETGFDDEPMPVRHTFIHYGLHESIFAQRGVRLERSMSAPSIVTSGPFGLKVPAMTWAHLRNECKPCAYFMNKQDGCRLGDDCKFCHDCTGSDIKKRKKEKKRLQKKLALARAEELCSVE